MRKSQIEKATKWVKAYVDEHGSITPSKLVDLATNPDHPLHPFFEWDDSEAARKYRLVQGRTIIRKIGVTLEDPLVHVPKRVSVKVEDDGSREGVYRKLSVVRQHPDEFELAYAEAMRRLSAAHKAVIEMESSVSSDEEKVAIIGLAVRGLETAREAIQQLH